MEGVPRCFQGRLVGPTRPAVPPGSTPLTQQRGDEMSCQLAGLARSEGISKHRRSVQCPQQRLDCHRRRRSDLHVSVKNSANDCGFCVHPSQTLSRKQVRSQPFFLAAEVCCAYAKIFSGQGQSKKSKVTGDSFLAASRTPSTSVRLAFRFLALTHVRLAICAMLY